MITASAGNHAQGLALAAQHLGVRAVIVMPRTTPELKVKGVLARGGEALLHGDAFPDALAHALQLAEREGTTFVPPYDDPDVIAGRARWRWRSSASTAAASTRSSCRSAAAA